MVGRIPYKAGVAQLGEPEEEEAIKHGFLPVSARPWKDGPGQVEARSVAPGMADRISYKAGVAQLVEQLIRNQ